MVLESNHVKNDTISFLSVVFFFFSLTCSMPCVGIALAGRYLSCFSILTIVVTAFLLTRINHTKLSTTNDASFYLYSFLCICILSGLMGVIYFVDDSIYANASRPFFSKVIIYLLLSILLFNSKISEIEKKALFYGLLVGAICNLIWASIDGLIFYASGISINNRVFASYIKINHIRYGQMSLIYSRYNIRTCGFNSDPAHIGVLAPFVTGYAVLKNKKILFIPIVLSIITSQSTTALVACILVLIVIWSIMGEKRKVLLVLIEICVALSLLWIVYKYTFLNSMIEQFLERISSKTSQNGGDSNRVVYNMKFLQAAIHSPLSFLFGTGLGTASFPFYKAGLINEKFAFDPEQTYVAYLFDIGIVGLYVYLKALFKSLKICKLQFNNKKQNTINSVAMIGYSSILAILFSNFFYHYICNAFQILSILIIICSFEDNNYENQFDGRKQQ